VAAPGPLLGPGLWGGPWGRGGGNRFLGVEQMGARRVLVVIALDGRAVQGPDPFQAKGRIGVVAHDIPHANIVRHPLGGGISEHRLQGFEIGVNVTEQGYPHNGYTKGRGVPIADADRRRAHFPKQFHGDATACMIIRLH